MSALLAINDLDVGYGHVGVLSKVSIDVEEGGIVVLLGSNGAGKTTLLKAISGLLRPSAGSIRFEGNEIGGVSPGKIVRAGLLHAAEGRALFRTQSVAANLELGLYGARLSKAEERLRYERVLALFPFLGERLSSLAGALSGGQQQMLAIAQALMQQPKLLMLDEPSLGLAPIIVDQVLDVVKALRREGTTIQLVEQMVERALEIADYAFILQNGRVIGEGDPISLASGDVIQRAYLGGASSQGIRV
ncbi:MAG: transporter ATP-binding protein [Tardiphaga sp.]|nr:transporter ATP-binding protein [Tardiphaga sp.]